MKLNASALKKKKKKLKRIVNFLQLSWRRQTGYFSYASPDTDSPRTVFFRLKLSRREVIEGSESRSRLKYQSVKFEELSVAEFEN